MDTGIKEDILKFIERISPQARDFVNEAFEHDEVTIFHYDPSAEEHGVFCMAGNQDCRIAYFSFDHDVKSAVYRDLIVEKMRPFLEEAGTIEVCFNVYGRNAEIIELIQELGFQRDMEGYHMFYAGPDMPVISNPELIEKFYDDSMLIPLAALFDDAYAELNRENGWKTNEYTANVLDFQLNLAKKRQADEFRSFWLGDELVGAYIIAGNYIRDLVVGPEYQNRGYGTTILASCIRHMVGKRIDRIYLRIAISNQDAKRMYERNHFKELAHFVEHTWVQ